MSDLSPVPSTFLAAVRHGAGPFTAKELASRLSLGHDTAEEYLRRLVRANLVSRRGPGVFTSTRTEAETFPLTAVMKRVSATLHRSLPHTPVVAWTTEWFAPYARNMPTSNWTLLETPRPAARSVADVLAREGTRVVVDPNHSELADVPRLLERPLVLWSRRDTSLVTRRGTLLVPRPERLLVDLYFDVTRRGLPFPEGELSNAIVRLLVERDLNIATVLSYAARRRLRPELAAYLSKHATRMPTDVRLAFELVTRDGNRGSNA